MFDLETRHLREKRRDMEELFGSLNLTFDEFFGDTRYMDNENNLIYEIECPGFNKENLTVELVQGVLTVKGKRGEGNREKTIFKRITLGTNEQVDAGIKDGILTLTFKQPEKKSTKIELK
jgi:HSP20 family molecular chaperone IbpA